MATPAHRECALLRAGLLGGPLAPAPHRHLVGLAPAVPAGRPRHGGPAGRPAPGGLGGHRARPDLPRGALRRAGTSRCAGATAASAGCPRPRATSTHRTTSFPGTSPCDERLRPHGLHAPAARPRAGLARRSCCGPTPSPTSSLVRQASADPFIPSISSVPRTYTDDAGRAFIERQHARDAEGDGYSFVIAPETEPRGRHRVHRAVAAGDRERARLHRLLARRRRPRATAWPRTRCAPSCPSPSARWRSRASISSSSPGTWRRPGRPRPPASAARRRCGAGSASTASNTMPIASPSCMPEWAAPG